MRVAEQATSGIEPSTIQANPTCTPKVEPLPPLHQGSLSSTKTSIPREFSFLCLFESLKNNELMYRQMFGNKMVDDFLNNETVKKMYERAIELSSVLEIRIPTGEVRLTEAAKAGLLEATNKISICVDVGFGNNLFNSFNQSVFGV